MLVAMKADSVDLRPQILRYKINPFDMYDQNPQQFTVHKALERVNLRQNRKLLQIDEEGWKKFIGIMNFYDRLSHPSILAAATTRKFDTPGTFIFGAGYDSEMRSSYGHEIKLSLSACQSLSRLDHVMYILKKNSK
jgi:hypothetical protein